MNSQGAGNVYIWLIPDDNGIEGIVGVPGKLVGYPGMEVVPLIFATQARAERFTEAARIAADNRLQTTSLVRFTRTDDVIATVTPLNGRLPRHAASEPGA